MISITCSSCDSIPQVPLILPIPSNTHRYTKQADSLSSVVCATQPLVVGVFANNDLNWVEEVASTVGLDIIQLSGHEGLNAGGKKFAVPVWKAVHVKTGDDPNVILADLGAGTLS